jgi:hypothetical protein
VTESSGGLGELGALGIGGPIDGQHAKRNLAHEHLPELFDGIGARARPMPAEREEHGGFLVREGEVHINAFRVFGASTGGSAAARPRAPVTTKTFRARRCACAPR